MTGNWPASAMGNNGGIREIPPGIPLIGGAAGGDEAA
jgi:hypothetical protein